MKIYKNLHERIFSKKNLILAWRKSRKGKTKKEYVKRFEENLIYNLNNLNEKLVNQTYTPKSLQTFILRDPKTRKISKSDFRDRIVHHAVCNIIEPLFDKIFIYDNSANRKGKGNLFAIKRFYRFIKKVSRNGKTNGWFNENQIKGYCFKADIKHYFKEIDKNILFEMIKKKINCEKTLWLISRILEGETGNSDNRIFKGIPLGNLTSQFFANVYLNELDQFVKHKLKSKYYIRYVDDFVILHSSKEQLEVWKKKIEIFLKEKLSLELHPDKSKIINLSRGVDFVGFRNFYGYRLLRKRNIQKIKIKINSFKEGKIPEEKFEKIWQGWNAYAEWSYSYNLKKKLLKRIKINYP